MEGVKNVIFFYVLNVIIKNNLIIFVLIVEKKNIYIYQLHTKIIKNVGIGMVINMLTFLNFSL